MLFEINSLSNKENGINMDFFNLPEVPVYMTRPKADTILDPSIGLIHGNMFKDEYQGYKHYKPMRLTANTEQERMLLRIQELDFAINDLGLVLDLDPNNYQKYELLKKYAEEYNNLCTEYSKKYEVLELAKDTGGRYTWYESPWPWDGGHRYV